MVKDEWVFLEMNDVATILGLSVSRVAQLVKSDELVPIGRTVRRVALFDREDVLRYKRERARAKEAKP